MLVGLCHLACLTVILPGLLAACSPADVVLSESRPTIAGELLSFPGQQDPVTLRLASVSAAVDHPVVLPGRLAWDEGLTSRVYAPPAWRIEHLLAGLGQRVQRGQALVVLTSVQAGPAQAERYAGSAPSAGGDGAEADDRDEDLPSRTGQNSWPSPNGVDATALTESLTLTAARAGVVVERNSGPAAEGRSEQAATALFVLSDPTRLWATFDLDESQLALLKAGQAITLASPAWPGQRFAAQVLSIGRAVDAVSHSVKVRARVANPEGRLKAEMFVTAELRSRVALPLVPVDAVFLRGEQSVAFVALGGGRFERCVVRVRAAGPQFLQVLAGLSVGDSVVVGGALDLNALLDAAP